LNGLSDQEIKYAALRVREGELVIYPTDTLYGIGCNALDEEAVRRVFAAKKRDTSKPLSIAVSDLKMLRKYTRFDKKGMRVMERFLPGPVTFILRKKNLPEILTGGSDTVGVRIPEERTALRLIMEAGVPIVSTSANISGGETPLTAEEARKLFPDVSLSLEKGRLTGPPSTIIDMTVVPPRILREGKKPALEVTKVIEEVYGG
jgi:L-threonylcarbamoyladenylate synthase